MEVKFYPSCEKISRYVSGYIYVAGYQEKPVLSPGTVKPTMGLCFLLTKESKYWVVGDSLKENDTSADGYADPLILGLASTHVDVYFQGKLSLLFVAFTPIGLHYFLQQDVSPISNNVLSFSRFDHPSFSDGTVEKIKNAPSIKDKVALVEREFVGHFSSLPEPTNTFPIGDVLDFIQSKKGIATVNEIVGQFGLHPRTLEMQFKRQVGIPPKLYCRMLRFNRLLQGLSKTPALDCFDWIEEFGYTDQSHFHKDFKQFAGRTPRQFFRSPDWPDKYINGMM